jgi:mannan endo-1,4-beta-mannosidase
MTERLVSSTRRKRAVYWGSGVALLAALGASSCIKREGPAGEAEAPKAAVAQSAANLPPGVALVPASGVGAFAIQGKAELAEIKTVSVDGQPFKEALEANVKDLGESEWAVQVQAGTAAPVEKDDVLLATFYARVVKELEGGGGQTSFVFERAGEPYTKSVTYPVMLSPEWRKIQVRFSASESYASGGAQIIFRLGYAPETIQIGGVSVENFQKKVTLSQLPTTQTADKAFAQAAAVAKPLEAVDAGDLLFDIKAGEVLRKISPYVYGLNSQELEATGASVRRNGGNRGSVYNWEINASNAGKDWHHTSDDWPCTVLAIKNCGDPAAQFIGFYEQNKKAGAATVVTVPMLDYASADKSGEVKLEQKPPSQRFVKASPKKPGPLAATPDLKDGAVYQDEFVNYLVTKLGKAKDGGVKFYSLDNEPALWSETHPFVHAERTTYAEVVKRSEETAKVISDIDPSAFILGGVMFGWAEYQSLSSAPDAGEYKEYGSYLEFFLASLKKLEQKHGRRLVHALDVHWYPEARGTDRITQEDASRATIDARLQAPRSLWDPKYAERSWIVQQTGKPLRLIPWLREAVQKRYAGTELAMTEYNYGATTHVSGALAQVDVLGVLGREGVYLANYWGKGAGVGKLPPYIASAFQLYRNYDGKGGQFGDTAVKAIVTDDEFASVFAATDTKQPNVLTIIAVNKTQQKRFDGVFRISGAGPYGKVDTFAITPAGTAVKPGETAKIEGNIVRYKLAPLTATLFVLRKG